MIGEPIKDYGAVSAKIRDILRRTVRDHSPAFFLKNYKLIVRHFKYLLAERKWSLQRPAQIYVAITNDCNYRCLYCFTAPSLRADKKDLSDENYYMSSLPFDTFKRLIDDITGFGRPLRIVFNDGGNIGIGEPFMHNRIMDMCRYVRTRGHDFRIVSNGSLITKEVAQALIETGVEQVCISLNASTSETYSHITAQNSHAYAYVNDILKLLVDYRNKEKSTTTKIFIGFVVCSLNYLEVLEVARLGLRLGVDGIMYRKFAFCSKRQKRVQYLIPSDEQIAVLKRLLWEVVILERRHRHFKTRAASLLRFYSRGDVGASMDYRRKAANIINNIVILGDGSLYAMDYPELMGNINVSSLYSVWHSPQYSEVRKRAHITSAQLFPCYPYCRECDKPLYSPTYHPGEERLLNDS